MFNQKTLGGNVVASAEGASFFTYETDDTKATIITAGYFMLKDANGQLTSGVDTANKILYPNDLIMVDCSDGLFIARITVSTPVTVNAVAVLEVV